jgi:hypothetical protein
VVHGEKDLERGELASDGDGVRLERKEGGNKEWEDGEEGNMPLRSSTTTVPEQRNSWTDTCKCVYVDDRLDGTPYRHYER